MNVLLLVLDCLREDAITKEIAPNLHGLAASNLSFKSCITPANWSLPAHASLFTGEWPHEHKRFHREQHLDHSPLVRSYNEKGYDTVGVSANIYASSSHGFDTEFDQFYETRRPLNPRGLNPFANVRRIQEDREPSKSDYFQTLVDSVAHEAPIASIGNFGRAVLLELDRRYACRQYVPLLRDDKYGFLTRASRRTSKMLAEAFEQNSASDQPLFAFANYMDTHYPYQPPEEHFYAVTNGEYDIASLHDIDPNIASSKRFLNEYFSDGIDEEALSLIRAAYRGEVSSVDEQIGDLLGLLTENGLRENTLVIVTADHGECLGEEDLRGERGMGHLDSLNEHLWKVPLIISNPKITPNTVDERVSLKSLFDLLTGDLESFVDCGGQNYDKYFDEDIVFFELPANPYHESSFEKHENVPDWYVEREAKTHTVLGFDGDWCVTIDSRGERSAWHNGVTADVAEAPDELVSECCAAVDEFPEIQDDVESSLSGNVEQQLEDLGYL